MYKGLFNCEVLLGVHRHCMTVAPVTTAAAGGTPAPPPTPPNKPAPTPPTDDTNSAGWVASIRSFESDMKYTWEGNEVGVNFCDSNSEPIFTGYVSVC